MDTPVGNKLKDYITSKMVNLVIKQDYNINFKYEPHKGQISAVVSKNGEPVQTVIIPEEYFNIKTTDNHRKQVKLLQKENK